MPHLGHRAEPVLIQELIANLAVQALSEPVLARLARRDVMPVDSVPVGPLQDGAARQFGAVVADDAQRLTAVADQCVEFANDPRSADGGIRRKRHSREH